MGVNGRSNGRSLESRLELWRKRFQEFSSGACTVDQFCKQVGVTAPTFYYWRKKLGDSDKVRQSSIRSGGAHTISVSRRGRQVGDAAAQSGSFVPVRIASTEVSGDVVIRLPSGTQVRIPASASELIATVIAQLCDLNAATSVEAA